jgi:hypothetical protein
MIDRDWRRRVLIFDQNAFDWKTVAQFFYEIAPPDRPGCKDRYSHHF